MMIMMMMMIKRVINYFLYFFRGFQVENNTTSIGKYTTISVVNAIFVVILLDAVFSVIFTQMGI